MFLGSHNEKGFRRFLRKRRVQPEFILWQSLRNRGLLGLKFKRQQNIGKFITDFYCFELKLAVEIDGDSHKLRKQKMYDQQREGYFHDLGIRTLRFSNEDVMEHSEMVLKKIEEVVESIKREEQGLTSPEEC